MRLISVDIGNRATKFGIARGDTESFDDLTAVSNKDALTLDTMQWLTGNAEGCQVAMNWTVCSVNPVRTRELENWVRLHRPVDGFQIITADDIEMAVDVQSRELLGRDRLLAAWQARRLFPEGNVIIVDAGTAVTVDVVDSHSVFQGGLIFPGAATMLQLLARQTASLPDLSDLGLGSLESELGLPRGSRHSIDRRDASPLFPTIGKSTKQALLIGVYQTQLSTLQNVVETIRQEISGSFTVITTGGGMAELQAWLPLDWHYRPTLLLEGAAAIGRKRFSQ